MRTRQQSSFSTITSEGALLPLDLLQKIALFDSGITGLDGGSYHQSERKLNEAISESWGKLLRFWQVFQNAREKLQDDESGLTQTRERWLLNLFQELGYGRLYTVKPEIIDEKSYPISHGWNHLPMHLVSFRTGLEDVARNMTTGMRFSPYSLVQEFLNRSGEHLWGLVSNGLRLRLLRKNASLTRQAYVEFDLEAMFTGESYADFVLFWLLCHQSRVESEHPAECWLERWSRLAQEQGVRVLDQLRNGVEEAIEPGKPLSFLDAHIKHGNSLLGATPRLLREGIPDEAFEAIEGDDKKICSEFKKLNKNLRAGQQSLFREDHADSIWEQQGTLMHSTLQLEEMREDTVEEIHRKEQFFVDIVNSGPYANALLWANAWCAAFVWKKTAAMRPTITDEEFRDIGKNPFSLSAWRKTEIERLAAQYQFFHWHLAFPEVFLVPEENPENEQAGWSGGFDVVLGNPPWERIKIQEKEWFAIRKPAIANAANAAARRKMIVALQGEDPELYTAFMDDQRQAAGESHFVRHTSRYPLCGRGDVNTYAIFAENMRWIIGATGRVGCIVPSGIATDDTTKFFFQDMMESHTLRSLFSFENEARLFPGIDHRVKFALLTLTGNAGSAKNADFVYNAHITDDLKDQKRHFTLTSADIVLFNPNTRTCPIFRSKRDMDITKTAYEKIPVLIKEGSPDVNPWNISFRAMFHMANDSHLFHTKEQLQGDGWKLRGNIFCKSKERYLPLYEGKMVWHFDHRFGTYEGQTQAQANQGKLPEFNEEQHANPSLMTIPRYWVHESHIPEAINDGRTGFPVFRDITNSGVLRTAIFSILPLVLCGDTAHAVILDYKNIYEALYLASCGASFIFDYITRQKLGGSHLKYFVVRQLPMLPPNQFKVTCDWDRQVCIGDWIAPRALELTYTAWDLEAFAKDCGYDGPPFRWDEERRFLLRCELDAAYFHLYGIARDDVDYIMDTFRVWREKEEKLYHEYRTKRVILEIYDEMQQAIESGEAYRTRLEPGPADAAVAHPARVSVEAQRD